MVASFKSGEPFAGFFVLRSKEIRIKKDNTAKYLAVELGDASGRIFGSVWQDAEKLDEQLEIGALVKAKGHVIEWHHKPHLSVEQIRATSAADKVNLEDFIPQSAKNSQEIFNTVEKLISTIQNPFLASLLQNIFSTYTTELKSAPGGKLWHHAYVGGLMEHSVNLALLCNQFAMLYTNVHKELLLAGALLHDIGKIYEYKTKPFIDYTDVGRLHGHIALGYHLVATEIEKIPDFPDDLKQELLHLILSHQGSAECGSPIQPLSREAFLLNYADEIDAKMNAFERIYEREGNDDRTWSSYVNLLNRFLYFGKIE